MLKPVNYFPSLSHTIIIGNFLKVTQQFYYQYSNYCDLKYYMTKKFHDGVAKCNVVKELKVDDEYYSSISLQ